MNYEELLNAATALGDSLLENGAEIYRVEESMHRMFQAYGAQGDVFAIPTCIVASVSAKDGRTFSKTKRIYTRGTNFDKVKELNDLCRRVCRDTPSLESVWEELRSIESRPVYRSLWQILACALVAFSFTLFFGGNLADAFCAAPAGALVKLATIKMEKFHTNQFFTYIAGSALGALIALTAVHLHLGVNLDKIIIGVFMNLVPGVAMTNAIRDIIAGDLVSGIAKVVEALMIGVAIALGAGIAIFAARLVWGVV